VDGRRVLLTGLATALGFALAGCLLGVGVGLVAPDLYRSLFGVYQGSPFDPVSVGLGIGCVAGFAAGTVVAVAGLVMTWLPGLTQWRPFARGALQPSLGGLVLMVLIASLGLVSLKDPSRAWVEVWFGATALALASATLAAFRARPGRHGFATGFAVFGWTYFLLSLFPESRAQLPTSRLLAILEKHVSGGWKVGVQSLTLEMGPFPAHIRGASWEPVVTSRGGIPGFLSIDEVQPEFRQIGHALFTLTIAIVGGVLSDIHRGRLVPPPALAGPALGTGLDPRQDGTGADPIETLSR
jgi:hypothetical protein